MIIMWNKECFSRHIWKNNKYGWKNAKVNIGEEYTGKHEWKNVLENKSCFLGVMVLKSVAKTQGGCRTV